MEPEKGKEILRRKRSRQITVPKEVFMGGGGSYANTWLRKKLDWIEKKKEEQEQLFHIWNEHAHQKSKPCASDSISWLEFMHGPQVSHSFGSEEPIGDGGCAKIVTFKVIWNEKQVNCWGNDWIGLALGPTPGSATACGGTQILHVTSLAGLPFLWSSKMGLTLFTS